MKHVTRFTAQLLVFAATLYALAWVTYGLAVLVNEVTSHVWL